MKAKSSNDLTKQPLRKDAQREMQDAIVQDADKTGVDDRDLVHGEGGTVGIAPDGKTLNSDD